MSATLAKARRVWSLHVARHFRSPKASDLLMMVVLGAVALLLAIVALVAISGTAQATPLTAGDRIELVIEAGEGFAGRYQLDGDGQIVLPHAGPVKLAGMEPDAAAALISDRLVAAALFRRQFVRTSVLVLVWAPIQVHVSGAVFYPGGHRINQAPSRDRAPEKRDDLPGAGVAERRLSDALRAAGGVTPWADVSHIAVRRNGMTRLYNLWSLVIGQTGHDPSLQDGDEIIVASLPEAQPALARPSAITPPGIKIFLSNLIQPAQSNAQATASGGALSLAYGSRFAQAAVAGNCVGGIGATSASRSAVLVRTDRVTGRTTTWDSPVEALIRDTTDARNPVLLEGDAVACYDSGTTGLRDVFRTLTDLLTPFALFRGVRW